jgi:hypothetical protein
MDPGGRRLREAILHGRAGFLWATTTARQRRGYFCAGLGAAAGMFLDANAATLNKLLAAADKAVAETDILTLAAAVAEFAQIVFQVAPFAPRDIPPDWRKILLGWLEGSTIEPLVALFGPKVTSFIEDGLTFRLVWALEAVRVRAIAHEDEGSEELTGRAAIAIETGMANISAALLIQAGLSSRVAALRVVTEGAGQFGTLSQMRNWLSSTAVELLSKSAEWPTGDTARLWQAFRASNHIRSSKWSIREGKLAVAWRAGARPAVAANMMQVVHDDAGPTWVYSAQMERLGRLLRPFSHRPVGILAVTGLDASGRLSVQYTGPPHETGIV